MYIIHPESRRRIFLDNSLTKYEDRLNEVLTKVLTSDIIDYCQDNSLIKNKRQILSYENAEHLLENLATYLLWGQFEKNGILTIFQIRQSQVKEIPASSSDSNAEDIMYAINFSEEISEKGLTASTDMNYNSTTVKDEKTMSVREIERETQRKTKSVKKYKNSRAYRMEKLHSTNSIKTYRLKQKFVINDEGKRVAQKNMFGQPVFEAVYGIIGGRVGVIDESNRYQSKWCTVDTDNEFVYNNTRFKIDESVVQYKVEDDNKAEMDKILVVPTKDGLKFFDQDINEVLDKSVSQM